MDSVRSSISAKIQLEPIKDPENFNENAEAIRILLETVNFDWKAESGSELSDLTDPMEDFHTDSVYSKKELIKGLNRNEINKLIVEDFTDEHKAVTRAIRKETNVDGLFDEAVGVFNVSTDQTKREPSEETKKKKLEILKDSTHFNEEFLDGDFEEFSEMTYDYMSGIWKMLEVECKEKEFFISPENYNVYEEFNYWLNYPAVPWEIVEESKEKCTEWLKKYHKKE